MQRGSFTALGLINPCTGELTALMILSPGVRIMKTAMKAGNKCIDCIEGVGSKFMKLCSQELDSLAAKEGKLCL